MSHLMYPERRDKMPLHVRVKGEWGPGNYLWLATAIACEPWNKMRAEDLRDGLLQLVDHTYENPDAIVQWSEGRTWVDARQKPYTLYVQSFASYNAERTRAGLSYSWAEWLNKNAFELPHELGHLLNFADHVPAGTNLTGYVNPAIIGQDGNYQGVMSYRTPVWMRFQKDDRDMVKRAYD